MGMTRSIEHLHEWLQIAPGLLDCQSRAYGGETGPIICPRLQDCFHAFEYFSPAETRVVILGQDPYHTPNKASGLAFGYHPDYVGRLDSSLQNIVAELLAEGFHVPGYSDGNVGYHKKDWFTLRHWAQQGVLLLNTCLSVEMGDPMSHSDLGWQQQIQLILKYLVDNTDTVYIGWGREAQRMITEAQNANTLPVFTSHPCKYSHMSGNNPFSGSGCFTLVNEILEQKGKEKIKW